MRSATFKYCQFWGLNICDQYGTQNRTLVPNPLLCGTSQTKAITIKQLDQLERDTDNLLSSPEGAGLVRDQPFELAPTTSVPSDCHILYVKTLMELALMVSLQAAGGTHLAMVHQPSAPLLTKANSKEACTKIEGKLLSMEKKLKITVRWTPVDDQYKVRMVHSDRLW